MKILSVLKILPLVSVIAIGTALSPTLSMADNDKRSRDKGQYSHDGGKSHVKSRIRDVKPLGYGREVRNYSKHGDKHRSKHYRGKGYGHNKPYKGHKHGHYGHHSHHGHHGHSGHNHTNVIVHDYGVYDYARRHYLSLDDLRFTFGLHADNFDIILHD